MCGIAGLIGPWSDPEARMTAMLEVQKHRGPDDHGIWLAEGVCLGHRRLSIIDLTASGHQPMSNEDGTVWIVFNGEIYNYAEIGRELTRRGHRLRSTSDTEVIIHAYEQWGERCFERFNGMWGIVLWDAKQQVAICSRDRLGVKPLYYYASGDRLAVASEIKGILASGVTPEINEPYAAHVIADGLLDDRGAETLFAGVRQLLPGHILRFSVRDGMREPEPFWRLDPEAAAETYDYTDPVTTVRALLADAVHLRMLASDVPVGSCLSGGLDSSSIVSLAARDASGRLKTFTVEYPGTTSDESRYSRLVAERFGCDSVRGAPDPRDYLEVLEQLTWFMDEPPVSSPGSYSQWKVFELVAPQVKVVLDGQGGDELFGGYHGHVDAHVRWLIHRVLTGHLGYAGRLGTTFAAAARFRSENASMTLARAVAPRRLLHALSERRSDVVAGGLAAGMWESYRSSPPDRHVIATGDTVNAALFDDLLRDKLPGYLHYEDRLSMGFSVESRTPFLDYRLVEYLAGMAGHEKMRKGATKWLLREAMHGITPQEILDRKDKMGFATPTAGWFRDQVREDVREYLLDERTRQRGVLDMGQIESTLTRHNAGAADASNQIFRWLALECWFRRFFDHTIPGAYAGRR